MKCKICRQSFNITTNACTDTECNEIRNGNICLDCHNFMHHSPIMDDSYNTLTIGLNERHQETDFHLRASHKLCFDNNITTFLHNNRFD